MNIRDYSELKFSNDVIELDGTYFLHQENKSQEQFAHLIGNKKIDEKNIANFNSNIERAVSLSNSLNFKYRHIVFPAKPYVYRENFRKIGCNIQSMLSFPHNKSYVMYPNLLQEHYDKLDTHVNDLGIIHIINLIAKQFDVPLPPEPVLETKISGGDLAAMSGNGATCPTIRFFGYGFKDNMRKIKSYSISSALEGNTGHFDFSFNPYAIHKARLVLFGDSFFRTRIRIFSSLFSEVIYFRNPFVMEDIVRNLRPDLVLTGNAERYLVNVPNALSAKPWFLNYLGPRYDSKKVKEDDFQIFNYLFSGQKLSSFGMHTKTVTSYFENLKYLKEKDIKNSVDIQFIADAAVSLEETDIDLALHLMQIAASKTTDSAYYKEKIRVYKKYLGSI